MDPMYTVKKKLHIYLRSSCLDCLLHIFTGFFTKKNLRQETSPIWQRGNAPIADHVQSCTSEFSLSKSGAMLEKIIPKWYMV